MTEYCSYFSTKELTYPKKLRTRFLLQYFIHYPHDILLPKQVIELQIEERIEVTERQERRRKQLLDDLKVIRGHWILKERALDRNL